MRLSVSEGIVQELLARDGLRATVRASASLEAMVQMALDGLGIAVVPPAIIEKKADARAKSRRLNTTIKLPNLDEVASWPTAADDTGPQGPHESGLDSAKNAAYQTSPK